MSKQVQWYPGHMNKSLQSIKEISKKIDCIFLILDARAPKSSFIETFKYIIENKKVIVLLNKSDLVEKNELNKWINFYKLKYENVFAFSTVDKRNIEKKLLLILENIKFKSLIPKFLILGIPNVGKSTFLNAIIKKRKAEVQNKAGVTKKLNWYQFEKKYWILDTPGILEPKFEIEEEGIILASIGSFKYDILPLNDVAIELLKIISTKKNVKNFNFDIENIEDDLEKKLKMSKITEHDFYKKILLDFQNGKFGKIILDNIEK